MLLSPPPATLALAPAPSSIPPPQACLARDAHRAAFDIGRVCGAAGSCGEIEWAELDGVWLEAKGLQVLSKGLAVLCAWSSSAGSAKGDESNR